MIINNLNSISSLYTSNAVAATKKSDNASKKVRSFQDEMLISNEAQVFKTMIKKLHNTSDVRQDKIEEYSRKIEEGSYDVKAENIAASILMNRF